MIYINSQQSYINKHLNKTKSICQDGPRYHRKAMKKGIDSKSKKERSDQKRNEENSELQINQSKQKKKNQKRGRKKKEKPKVYYEALADALPFQQQQENEDIYTHSQKELFTDDKGELSEQEEDSEDSAQTQLAKNLHAFKEDLELMDFNDKNSQETNSLPDIRYFSDTDKSPTTNEIVKLIQELKDSFPLDDIPKIVSQLYSSLIKKESDGQDNTRLQYQKIVHQKMELGTKFTNYEDNMKAIEKASKKNILRRFIKNPNIGKNFSNPHERTKFLEKHLVAKAFCNRGYGMQGLSAETEAAGNPIYIDRCRYKVLAATIVVQTYRKLQNFLMDECHRNIRPLTRFELRSIETILLNCRKHFQTKQYTILLNFMKLAYSLSSVTITQQDAIRLYIVIQKTVRSRVGEIQMDRMADTMKCNKQFKARRSFQSERFLLHRFWTDELELQFLNLYKQYHQLLKTRNFFKGKYPEIQHLFTIDSLRSRFNKILRVALRKTHCFCQKFGQQRVPSLIKLNDLRVKHMLRSPEALNVRLLLIEMYLHNECDIKRLYQTVSTVNEFVIMKDKERLQQIIEAEPMIASATQKINHNVSISRAKRQTQSTVVGEKSEIFLKGREENFDHIVQTQGGKRLHYYRKADSNNNNFENQDPSVKQQDGRSVQNGSIYNFSENSAKESIGVEKKKQDSDQLLDLESIIKEEMHIYLDQNANENLSSMSKEQKS